MMKFRNILSLFVLFIILISKLAVVYSACEVKPLTILDTLKAGEVKVHELMIKNVDVNKTHSYKLVISGSITNYTVLSDDDFTLLANTSKVVNVYLIVPTNAKDGIYEGYIFVYEDGVICRQVYEKITISSWIYETTKWISVPSTMYINNYKFNITFTSDKSCVIINDKTMCRDQENVFYENVKIKVLDINRENNQVYLDISTKFNNPTITVKQTSSENVIGVGNVDLYPSFTTKRIQKGLKSSTVVLYFYNGLDVPVNIVRVYVSGDQYTFEDGTTEPVVECKPAVPSAEVQPGDQIPIIVKLSSTRLEPGSYTITLTVAYRIGRIIRFKNAILNVIVFKSAVQTKNVEIQMPSSIAYDKEFVIKVKNVDSNYKVNITFSNRNCVVGSGFLSNNEYIYNGKVICKDINRLGIYVNVYKDGILVKNLYKEYLITASKVSYVIRISPEHPKPGDKVNIYVVDSNGNIVSNAKIYVNGLPMTSFIAEPNKKYIIIAEIDGQKISKTIQIVGKKMKVLIIPPNPKLGDKVTIKAFDMYTNEPLNATIKINGKTINGTFNITQPGTYIIEVTANGYQAFRKIIKVEAPLNISINKEVITLGESIYATSTRNVVWEVYYQKSNNELILVYKSNTPSRSLLYKPNKPGTYIVKAAGKQFKITVKKKSSIPSILILIAFVVVVLVIARKIIKKVRFRRFIKEFRKSGEEKYIEVRPIHKHTLPGGFPAQPLSREEEEEIKSIEEGKKEK